MKTCYRILLQHKFKYRKLKFNKSDFFFIILISLIPILYFYQINLKSKSKDDFEVNDGIYEPRNFYNGYILNRSRMKYILIWNKTVDSPFQKTLERKIFVENKCEFQNCVVTSNKNYLSDITEFDAIIFNVRHMQEFPRNRVEKRSPRQIYIFYAMDSPDYYPVCDKEFDGFFNWTMTYRLDSDLPVTYFQVQDKYGTTVAPKLDVKWKNKSGIIPRSLAKRLTSKYKAVAWFVSNCFAKSERVALANLLKDSLMKYGLDLDIYGKCGKLICPVSRQEDCNRMLRNDYYFYLAYESSFSLDYVTDKVLIAMENDVLPIVFGGADYSRFLPPNSYINALKLTYDELARKIFQLITMPQEYWKYFKWKSEYTISSAKATNICSLCAALNNKALVTKVHKNLREWWFPNYKDRCQVVDVNFSDYVDANFKKHPEFNTQPGFIIF